MAFRLTATQRRALERAAGGAGLTANEQARALVLAALGMVDTPAQRAPKPPPKAQPPRRIGPKRYKDLSPVERAKVICRQKTNYWVRTGVLRRQPCQNCGNAVSEAHHHDYTKPLEVEWLCVVCHRQHHADQNASERLARSLADEAIRVTRRAHAEPSRELAVDYDEVVG